MISEGLYIEEDIIQCAYGYPNQDSRQLLKLEFAFQGLLCTV